MSRTAIIYDCEFATAPGAQQRFWCGPCDPDPVVFQVGGVRMALDAPFDVLDSFEVLIQPVDRTGTPVDLDPLNANLTGISAERLACKGVALTEALTRFAAFAGSDRLWAWGKDEFHLMAISCYIAGIAPPLPATRFGNAPALFLAAGEPLRHSRPAQSHDACAFRANAARARAHDALDDARMVAACLQHLMQSGRLDPALLASDLRSPVD